MSIGAFATLERASAVLVYLDVVLVLIAAVPVLALGAPALGYCVGGGAWILGRVGSVILERHIAQVTELRRRLALGVISSMVRVWLLATAIVIVGVAGSRADGLTAALVIFGAFSVYFVRSAVAHISQGRRTA